MTQRQLHALAWSLIGISLIPMLVLALSFAGLIVAVAPATVGKWIFASVSLLAFACVVILVLGDRAIDGSASS